MKYLVVACGFVLSMAVFARDAGAQAQAPPATLVDSSSLSSADVSAAPGTLEASTSSPEANLPEAPQQEPGVVSVYQHYSWQASLGYTFTRLYLVPSNSVDLNGFTYSMAYYYKGGWWGGEGEFDATFGTDHNETSRLLLGMGGPRVRWSGPRGLELFAHGLVGVAHFSPQTAFGSEQAFGWQVGGGADLPFPSKRFGVRVGVDMVATRFFSTTQYSPKVSVGLVYRF